MPTEYRLGDIQNKKVKSQASANKSCVNVHIDQISIGLFVDPYILPSYPGS
jgi:hypothetical protein